MKYDEVKSDDASFLSLKKMIGVGIKDVTGYLTQEFDEPTFKMSKIIFEDGTILGCEGEHDLPYLVGYGERTPKNYSDENLEEILKSDPDYEA